MHKAIIISGPTGVGKTACVDYLAHHMRIEIVNADVGQMYVPLTIGTAKPDWRSSSVPHHLFDIYDTPQDCSVRAYRDMVVDRMQDICQRGATPVIVGGSLFYIKSLFFPPAHIAEANTSDHQFHADTQTLWNQLYAIDPDRAHAIHPHDRYRIKRALAIWYATGDKPSQYVPNFAAPSSATIAFLERDREELYTRINARVHAMLEHGWIEEVQSLDDQWIEFVQRKRIIGYYDIYLYLQDDITYDAMIDRIQKHTRNYAKRQIAFWRSLRQHVSSAYASTQDYTGHIMALSLSEDTYDVCAETIVQSHEELS